MLAHSIIIRDASNFRGLDERFFRLAVRGREENERLLEGLEKCLGEVIFTRRRKWRYRQAWRARRPAPPASITGGQPSLAAVAHGVNCGTGPAFSWLICWTSSLGDPPGWPHPVRLLGRIIHYWEDVLYQDRVMAGALFWLAVMGTTTGVLILGVLSVAALLPPWGGIAVAHLLPLCRPGHPQPAPGEPQGGSGPGPGRPGRGQGEPCP